MLSTLLAQNIKEILPTNCNVRDKKKVFISSYHLFQMFVIEDVEEVFTTGRTAVSCNLVNEITSETISTPSFFSASFVNPPEVTMSDGFTDVCPQFAHYFPQQAPWWLQFCLQFTWSSFSRSSVMLNESLSLQVM